MKTLKKIALFDLDHTLIPFDSDHAWGEHTISLGWRDPVDFKRRNNAFFEQYRAGTLDLPEYMRFATEAIRVQGAEKATAGHASFMQTVVYNGIKEEALALVRGHQQAGHEVVIVTATNEFVTRPIAAAFGVSELIAVELARDADGLITGEIHGTPSFREGKVTRVGDWLGAQQLKWDDVETWFYSDSMNDVPLLEKVTHAIATNPDQGLRALAIARGWRILDLF